MHKVLFVDDDPKILNGYRRQLGDRYRIETAMCGDQGLQIMREKGTFSLVVSDYRMPGMTGVEFLIQVRREWPETVRMILTGHADVAMAMKAVNEGNVFRFQTKPCSLADMVESIEQSISQYASKNGGGMPSSDILANGDFTEREQEIVGFLCEGLTRQEIATRLVVSPKTVDRHQENIKQKLGVETKQELLHRLQS